MNAHPPIIVEAVRGTLVESYHRVHAVVARADGDMVHVWGEAAREIYPRSAIKPLQALALIETGAAHAHGVGDEGLAVAGRAREGAGVGADEVDGDRFAAYFR